MSAPYARIYYSVMDDAKFDGIREDVRLFGAWALLLVVAEMAWPTAAYIPPPVPVSAFKRLCDCELVDALPGGRYRIHGMDAERGRRSRIARNASEHRWSNAQTMPRRDETRRDEKPAKLACPNDPSHDLVQADGKSWCVVCKAAIA